MPTIHMDVQRIQDGQHVVKNLLVSYKDEYPGQLPLLKIESGWQPRKGKYKDSVEYTVEEFPCSGEEFQGRGFRLAKEAGETYDVFIARSGQDSHCSCAGGTYGGVCKHRESLEGLMELGYLDDPHAYVPEREYVEEYEYVF